MLVVLLLLMMVFSFVFGRKEGDGKKGELFCELVVKLFGLFLVVLCVGVWLLFVYFV